MKIEKYLIERKRTEGQQSVEQKLSNYAMGMAGETGEVVDQIKKVIHQGHELDRDHVVKELGDDFWYRLGLMELLGITLEEVLEVNIKKLRARYSMGFTVKESVEREDD